MSKYNFEFRLQENDTNSYIAEKVSDETIVLEFGPANGRLTNYLSNEKGCTIDIVEIDEEAGKEALKYAREGCIGETLGNIEKLYWKQKFKNHRYDYIIFADVLEHLEQPQLVLKESLDLLKEKGSVLISVPNIAHNSIIAGLFCGRFDYHDTGLLDRTHLHFFTPSTIEDMINESGLFILDRTNIILGINDTEFGNITSVLSKCQYESLIKHEEGSVYETILQAGKCVYDVKKWTPNKKKTHESFAKIFWANEENKLNEQNSKVEYIMDGHVNWQFEIPDDATVLRIDPMNRDGVVSNLFLKYNGKKLKCEHDFTVNGYMFFGGDILFADENPQILIRNVEGGILNIEYDITDVISKSYEIFRELQELKLRLNEEKIENRDLKSRLEKSNELVREYEQMTNVKILKKIKSFLTWKKDGERKFF